MLFAQNLTKTYSTRVLFDGANLTISAGEKVGLVGPNGAGKSTLLKMLAGLDDATSGRVGGNGGDIGYLRQESDFDPANTLKDEMWAAFPELFDARRKLEDTEARLAAGPPMDQIDAISTELDQHFERFRLLGGEGFEGQADRILMGLGFSRTDLVKLCRDFSGGWRMRIALAKMLLRRPEHALLDEPTNHLDKEAIDWLAGELADYPGAVLIVSHQQEFLDRIVKRILEVRDGKVISYTGNYTEFLEARKEKARQVLMQAERQKREIAKQQAFIERFRSKATKAKQVQSRIKALEKVEKIETPTEAKGVRFLIRSSGRLEQQVVVATGISHDWEGQPALLDVSLAVERGHKIALTGPNGGGKSTLLRIIAGEVKPDEGTVEWSERALPGYYAQHQDEALDRSSNVLEEVRKSAGDQTDEFVRGILGRFLFSGDDVFKPVSALSGGERSRLALAKFLIKRTNVLLLDEPTNHLDAASRAELLKALAEYDGTIICASHDPAIVDQIATHVYHMDGGELSQVRVRDDRLAAAGKK